MTNLDLHATVGQWVAEHPQTSRIFEAAKIDYCCGGRKPLAQACLEHQLDPEQILAQLIQAADTPDEQPERNWPQIGLAALCDHIEQTHHAYLRQELPRLTNLIAKLVNVHGAAHGELAEVEQYFADLRSELEPHMFKEEQILFPAIRRLEQADTEQRFPFGTVANPIRMMEIEHDTAGNAMARIRELTSDYLPPADACNTYRATLDALLTLEQDLHVHIHKENNILFPSAIEREQSLPGLRIPGRST